MYLLSQTDSRLLQRRIQVILATSLILVALTASVATAYNLWHDREDTRADERRALIEQSALLLTSTESLLERAEHSLRGVEAALRTGPESVNSERLAGTELARALRYESVAKYLVYQTAERTVLVGELGTLSTTLPADALGPREASSGASVRLGQPLKLTSSSDYLYPLILDTTDRSGQAVRLAALMPRAALASVVEQISASNHYGLGLTLLDGTIWIRHPYFEKFVGAKIAGSVTVTQALRGDGVVNGRLAPNNEPALFAVTASHRYPFFAVSGEPTNATAAMLWGRGASQLANLCLLFALLIAASLVTRQVVRRLASSESFYRTLFDGVSDSVIVSDENGVIVGANDQAATLVGKADRSQLQGRSLFSLICVEGAQASAGFEELRRQFAQTERAERRRFAIRVNPSAEEATECVMTVSAVEWRGNRMLVCVIKDVATEQRYLRQVEALTRSDPLTGLPNRSTLEKIIDTQIQTSPRDGFAVMMCDVLRLREVNEAYGHQVGDVLLGKIGTRLQHPQGDRTLIVGRHGGGAFIVLVSGIAGVAEARAVCKTLREAIAAPLPIGDTTLEVALSIGVAVYPQAGATAAQLLRRADLTLERAKERRQGFLVYDLQSEIPSPSPDLALRTELAHAIRDGTLQLAFQPKIRLEDSEIVGAEMLLRWKHPLRGWVSPAEFIPMAESTELIYPLTRWVLEATVRQIRQWELQGRSLAVSVNVSAINLQDPEFVPDLESLIKRSGIDPRQLELEITESALMHDHDVVAKRLFAICDLGVHLSLDDFGTGFSSLDYVRRFPFTTIKVDKSFVFGMLSREKDRQVVELTLILAKKLGLKSIAEGVETDEVAMALLGMGCDTVQGYLFSAPLLTKEFEQWRQGFADRTDRILRLVPGTRSPGGTRAPRMRPS